MSSTTNLWNGLSRHAPTLSQEQSVLILQIQCSNAMVRMNSKDINQSENSIVSQWRITYEVAQQDATIS